MVTGMGRNARAVASCRRSVERRHYLTSSRVRGSCGLYNSWVSQLLIQTRFDGGLVVKAVLTLRRSGWNREHMTLVRLTKRLLQGINTSRAAAPGSVVSL